MNTRTGPISTTAIDTEDSPTTRKARTDGLGKLAGTWSGNGETRSIGSVPRDAVRELNTTPESLNCVVPHEREELVLAGKAFELRRARFTELEGTEAARQLSDE
jgi:hypothetical protein